VIDQLMFTKSFVSGAAWDKDELQDFGVRRWKVRIVLHVVGWRLT